MQTLNTTNPKPILIGLLAKKRNGKDTVADYLVEKYGFIKLSFASPLKTACADIFGFNNEQLYGDLKEVIDPFWNVSPRTVLQYVGTDLLRNQLDKIIPNIGPNIWTKCMEKQYITILKHNPNARVVIADNRFQNEVSAIHKLNGTVIKIKRNLNTQSDEHSSEKGIDMINTNDFTLINNGTILELYENVDVIINKINMNIYDKELINT